MSYFVLQKSDDVNFMILKINIEPNIKTIKGKNHNITVFKFKGGFNKI